MDFDDLDTDGGFDYLSSGMSIVGSDGIATQFEKDIAASAQAQGIHMEVKGMSGMPFNQAANPEVNLPAKPSMALNN